MSRWLPVLAMSLCTLLAAPASAQVVIVGTDFGGELDRSGQDQFRDALREGLQRAQRGPVMAETAAASRLGSVAACRESACMGDVGATLGAPLAVTASVYAEAEIYDFVVTVYDAQSGEELASQPGDCTFCPMAEAVESFTFTAEAALSGVDTPAPRVATTPPVIVEPAAGPTALSIATVPEDASILIDGEVAGSGRLREDFEPGTRTIAVTSDGYAPYEESVTISEEMAGDTIYLRVVLSADARTVEVPVEVPVEIGEGLSADVLARRRAIGGVMLGVGVTAASVGIGLLAIDGRDTCETGPLSACPEVYNTTAGGGALTALGGIVAGTGAGLLLTTRGDRSSRDVAWRVPSMRVGEDGWSAHVGVDF